MRTSLIITGICGVQNREALGPDCTLSGASGKRPYFMRKQIKPTEVIIRQIWALKSDYE